MTEQITEKCNELNLKAFALTAGITWGLVVLLTTYWFIIMCYDGHTLIKLSKIYLGYKITWFGGIIGFLWGFVDGVVVGGFFAWLYNRFAGKQKSAADTE